MHCPASGIRGTVYPVVYGKSEVFKLFHSMDNIFVSYACFFSLKWNTQQSLIFGNYNNKLHENTNLGKYESVFSPHF